MKTIAALIAGLLLSLTTFVAGLALALTFLNVGEPEHRLDARNTAALWSTEPVAVDKKSQSFERVPARVVPKAEKVAAINNIGGMGAKGVKTAQREEVAMVDPVTTGAIEETAAKPAAATWRSTAHADWCSRRYRSYNAQDNSYRPYGGGRRPCKSPYSSVNTADAPVEASGKTEAVTAARDQPVVDPEPDAVEQVAYEETASPYIDADHVQACFDRYRSYRPEDNTYQPFDGGPRRQCR